VIFEMLAFCGGHERRRHIPILTGGVMSWWMLCERSMLQRKGEPIVYIAIIE
jgi:hypothetical protein